MAVQSVELLLDDASDAAVRAQWTALLDAGLPSQARHTGASNRPHVTLAVAEEVSAEQDEALHAVAGDVPVPLSLGGLLVLGGRRGVLARLVVPSAALLALQSRATGIVGDTVAHTRPGTWTPHVTIAHRLTDDELDRALRVLRPVEEVTGTAVAVRRWDGAAKREWRLG